MLDEKLYLYSYYWNLTSDAEYFEDNYVTHGSKRPLELNEASVDFSQKYRSPVLYPTDKGWLSVYPRTEYLTENMNFNNSQQFSIEFEVFPTFK